MALYFAFSAPDDSDSCDFRKGVVSTLNPFLSIFITTNYNIRVRDLKKAFNETENFLVFSSEPAAIDYFNSHLNFAGTNVMHYETPPLFKVEIEEEPELNNEGFAKIEKEKLLPVAGKLLKLSHNHNANPNAAYIELTNNPNAIVHSMKPTNLG